MNIIIKNYDKPGKWEAVIPFDKEGMEQEWVGIVDARASGSYELRVIAEHTVAKTAGRVTVRVVCGEAATVLIKGVIRIKKEAQHTNNFLELRVLALGAGSRAVAEPELEIEANEVRASHAASVGNIEPEQMLYLQSRGLTKEQAQEVIVAGWLGV